ncbi:MAG: hypothetical protein WKF88_06045 [Ferruginibacter sp.]
MKLLFFMSVSIMFLLSCDDTDNYDVKRDNHYETNKAGLEEKEKKNPASFLTVTGAQRKNLIRQTIVRGKLYNNAKIVTYKDIELKLRFYSKTKTVLEEDIETIYETVTPGGSLSFKSKYFTPKGTDSVGISVISAKF